jgi:hypothetical protein
LGSRLSERKGCSNGFLAKHHISICKKCSENAHLENPTHAASISKKIICTSKNAFGADTTYSQRVKI